MHNCYSFNFSIILFNSILQNLPLDLLQINCMKKYLLPVFLLFSFSKSFCQEKKLLTNYTFRIDRFKALNFGVNADGRKQNNYNVSNSYGNALSGNFNASLFTTKSTNNLLQTISTGFATSGASAKSTSFSNTNKLKSLNILPSFFINNKWYAKNKFVEIGASFIDAFASSRSNDDILVTQNRFYNSNFIGGNMSLGIGKGRLENITDMQNAIWLHNILLKDGNLNRKLNEDEIIGLARAITTSNNRRVLDGRKRIQFILKNIDSYLQSKEVINKTDINYFSNLNDIVFFANNTARQAGTEKYIRVIPALANYYSKEENRITPLTSTTQNDNTAEVVLKIGLQKYKPLNLTHQIDYGAAAKANYGKSNSRYRNYTNANLNFTFDYDDEWKKIGLDYFLRYSIFPNTRTVIDVDFKGENGCQYLNGFNELYHTAILAANASYFISYNTRLNINLGTTYNKNNFDIRAVNRFNPSNIDEHNLAVFFNTTLNIAL
jgi:hypothetical protein